MTLIVHTEWSGINALLYYGPSIMASMGLEGDTVLLIGSGFINIVQFLFVIPAILLIDRWGVSVWHYHTFITLNESFYVGRRPLLMGALMLVTTMPRSK